MTHPTTHAPTHAPTPTSMSHRPAVVSMRGGYNAWNQAFDNKLERRYPEIETIQEIEQMAAPENFIWLDWSICMDPCPLTVQE